MTIHQSAYDENQGSPNLEAFQRMMEEWTKDDVSASVQVSEVKVVANASGSIAGITATIPVGAEIVDAVTICSGANSSGTMQVKTGATVPVAISDAMTCAVDKVVDRAASIDDDYRFVGYNGVKVFSHAEGDSGYVYILYKK